MINKNFKKWSDPWSYHDKTVKIERSHSIYKDKEEDTEDLIIDIEIDEDDITEITITCDYDILDEYSDYTVSEMENTVPSFVNNQLIVYDRNGRSVKASVRNKILAIV